MKFIEAISIIQHDLKRRIKNTEVAEKLGVSKQYINNVENSNKDLTDNFIERLESAFGISLGEDSSELHTRNDSYEIRYWEGVKDFPFLYHPDYRSCWFEKEIIRKWHIDKENLRCVRIFNDKMDTGRYPFTENDLAFMNIGDTDYSDGGVYLFTSEVNGVKNIFFSFVEPTIDGKVAFYTAKNPERRRVFSPEEVEQYNITIVGRLIKDVTKII